MHNYICICIHVYILCDMIHVYIYAIGVHIVLLFIMHSLLYVLNRISFIMYYILYTI